MDNSFTNYWRHPSDPTNQLSNISTALHATLDPRVSNEIRQQALHHLEQIKGQPDAPHWGFTLADDWKQDDAVRYYGLQLLEFAVRYRWAGFSGPQTEQLRTWVKCLAGSVRDIDRPYIRNKIAQIWAEVAKRCWGEEWLDMDTSLVSLWEKPTSEKRLASKMLVLSILETLSEDIMVSEDAAAGLRLDVLGTCINEIMVPGDVYVHLEKTRSERQQVRSGQQGWLVRVCELMSTCIDNLLKHRKMGGSWESVDEVCTCVVESLHTLRAVAGWIKAECTFEANLVDHLFLPFQTDKAGLQIAAAEVLYSLFSRSQHHGWQDTWTKVMSKAVRPDRIALLGYMIDQPLTHPGFDDEKYTLQKKVAELLSPLADSLAQSPKLWVDVPDVPVQPDVSGLLNLLLRIVESKSLVVSIPALHSWTKLLKSQHRQTIGLVSKAFGGLLQLCSARLLRYEALPESEDSDELVRYLHDDFETIPERHAFLGNYRRYCIDIIQTITRTKPVEALTHVLDQMRSMLENGPYTFGRGFDSASYAKTSPSVLQFEAQYQVVLSALKGYAQWLTDIANIPLEEPDYLAEAESDRSRASQIMREWSHAVINSHTDDPEVAAQVLQTLVAILRITKPESGYVLHVVQHLLTMRLYDNATHIPYADSIKNFETLRVVELQKLALAFPDELLEVYHELEPRISVLAEKHNDDARLVWGYKAFLFMVVHRASGIDRDVRIARLQEMLKPLYEAWQDDALTTSLTNLQAFCRRLGLADLPSFYDTYQFARVTDWSTRQLDDAGQARQDEIKRGSDAMPLRMTKSMLVATTEKLKPETEEYETACTLWSAVIPVVLPKLLQMLGHAQSFHNAQHWAHIPGELQQVVKRTLQDRFWQSGISNESRDDFYARISGSKTSYEGFASVVRGTVRNIREQGYHILYLMTKFDEQFFGIQDLATPLADALFADACSLSANHLHPIINLTTGLVQRCPPHYRATFLPPLLRQFFTALDVKISAEWEAIGEASQSNKEDDELGDEMRTESVLRQLTHSMVSFVPFLLEYERYDTVTFDDRATGATPVPKPTFSHLVLTDASVLEPLMLFCTHALRMRDTRCCTTICKSFRGLVPNFTVDTSPAPQVREFICTEVLKACITSLNEPYFAEMQKDLAALIAQIVRLYGPLTGTPRSVLLSLPGMSTAKVDKVIQRICKTSHERQQRAQVLDLLEGVRGVSIHEIGKVVRAKRPKSSNTVQAQYMEVEPRVVRATAQDENGLDGVADLFGDS